MKKLKSAMVISTLCMSLFSHYNAVAQDIEIPLSSYDTIIGENGNFIDLNSDRFLLNQSEWFEIQAYVEAALSLPTTEAKMKSALSIPDEVPFTDFKALAEEYKNVYGTAYTWKNDIYPNIVDLSLGLSNYAGVHSALFSPLFDALINMRDNSDWATVEANRQVAIQLLKSMKQLATMNQDQVEEAKQKLLTFSADLDSQKIQLDGLVDTHSDYLADDGSKMKQDISSLNSRISTLNDNYDHYVTVAATAVTYAWFPMVAIPIMGVYGDKAEKARMERNRLQSELTTLEARFSHKEKVYASYQRSTTSINTISKDIEKVIPHVNKLKSHWQGINSDFDTVLSLIEISEGPSGINNALAMVASITTNANLGQVQDKWRNIAVKAQQFAQNAYIVPVK